MYNHILFAKLFCTDKEYINRVENYKVYYNVLCELIVGVSNKYKEKYIIDFIKNVKNITGIDIEKDNRNCLFNIVYYNNLRYSEERKLEFICIIKELLSKIEMNMPITNKIFYMMIIFKLLDTKFGADFTNSYKRFKSIVEFKINQIQNQQINPEFSHYLKDNYIVNRKYISKERNKIYYRALLKTILFSLFTFSSLYKKVQNKGNYNCIIS